MGQALLQVENLTVNYTMGDHSVTALDDISFVVEKGGSLGIIGESGSGKTTTAMALMGLLGKSAIVNGSISYCDKNLQELSEQVRNRYRWRNMAIVFQNSLDVLNPVLTIYEQIYECLRKHTELQKEEAGKQIDKLLQTVGLDNCWQEYYPHQLSGGIRQRVLLAMALSCNPDVLIVDEPTNALDAVTKHEIIELLSELHKEKNFGLIVISHEIKTVAKLTSRLVVLYKGRIVEEGITKDILSNPVHNYTRGLLNSSPDMNPYRDLWGIPAEDAPNTTNSGCPFYTRCNQHIAICTMNKPTLEYVSLERRVACHRKGIVTIIRGIGINKSYEFKGMPRKVCDNCGLEIRSGEVIALIGQSGSGKTTLASILAGILAADNGEVVFRDEKVIRNSATRKKNGIQIVFQDPYSSINEHLTVEQVVREPLDILREESSLANKTRKVIMALHTVQLPGEKSFLERRCHTLSGGQRQRVALARALVMEPTLLIADEISSMLDPSTQANILRLLKELQNSQGFAMLYITHDLAVAQKIADKVYVMQQGRIVEKGNALDVFMNPTQSYTKKLVEEGLVVNQLKWRR